MEISSLRKWWLSLSHLFFPHRCAVCGKALQTGEVVVCMRCNMDMPRTNYHRLPDNPVERMFWHKLPLQRATSYFHYHKGSSFRQLLHLLKYAGRHDIGEAMGRFMAKELAGSGFFEGIDLLVPVPLHPRKKKSRGYNQSECIAKGISAITRIPLSPAAVARSRQTDTQTHKSAYERWENVKDVFRLRHPDQLAGKHILIIDDVLTTGATITACADAFAQVEGVRISILTLAVAGD